MDRRYSFNAIYGQRIFYRAVAWGSKYTAGVYNWTNITILGVGVWAIADKQSVDAVFLVSNRLITAYEYGRPLKQTCDVMSLAISVI